MFQITNMHVIMVAIALGVFGFIKLQGHRIDNLNKDLAVVVATSKAQETQINQLKVDFKNISSMDQARKESRAERDTFGQKLQKDSARSNVVVAKPGLVQTQINNSFNKFAKELQETTE